MTKIITYTAELYTPLYYNSREGHVIETDEILSATALSYALGYQLNELDKEYVLAGEESYNPDYSPIESLPFFVSDMKPLSVDVSERTFRSTDYSTEYSITTTDKNVAEKLGNSKGFPQTIATSKAAYTRVRNYVGITPPAEFQFTVWAKDDFELPDELRFRMGIGLSGELRAVKTETPEKVVLNEYMLSNVYDVPMSDIHGLLDGCTEYRKGNDPRKNHFIGVKTEDSTEIIEKNSLL